MVFVLFCFFTITCISLLAFGITKKNVPLVALAGVFFTVMGFVLISDGLRDEGSPTFVKNGNTVSVTGYAVLTTANDYFVYVISNLFLWGGLLILMAGLGLWLKTSRGNP